MTEQIIITPGGERLVIIPEAEFLAMREAFEDHEDREAVRSGLSANGPVQSESQISFEL